MQSSMLTRLNMETRGEHARADAPWLDLMGIDVTRGRYLDALAAIYGFEAPIDRRLGRAMRADRARPLGRASVLGA